MKAEADAGDTGTSGHFYPSSQYQPKKKKQQDAPHAGAHYKKKGPKANGKKPKAPPKKQAKKVKLTKKAQKVIAEKSWMPPVSKYVPGEFADTRKKFMDKAKSKGATHHEACRLWMHNKQASLISAMPPAELSRRRFA